MAELLRLEDVAAGYGQARILQAISFTVSQGCSLALLGRNGMGKTTLLATIMGATELMQGQILWCGQDLAAMPSYKRARSGIGWVPQERDIFSSLTLEQNLTVAAQKGHWTLARVYTLFPRLKERRHHMGRQLSGGEQQMLAVGRALMLNPRLLLLDEPLEGLAPLIAQELLEALHTMINNSGMAVILAEQQAPKILQITEKVIVLDRGHLGYQGDSKALAVDTQQLDQLLGLKKNSQ